MKPLLRIARFLVLCSLMPPSAFPQGLVSGADLPQAAQILDQAPAKSSLPCSIELPRNPELDFEFRYVAEFSIGCRLGRAIEPGAKLIAVLRITPQLGQPTLMMDEFDIPQVRPRGSTGLYAAPTQLEVSMSGGFAMGPGKYFLEVVLTDQHGHTCRRQRTLKSGEDRGAKNVPVALHPGAVAPLRNVSWNGALASRGLRVTVLLNAYGPGGAAMLHPWYRASLLESVATLLNQLPCQSVKLIAFNLDRQQEVFSQEKFDPEGFAKLGKILAQMELVTIPYQALRQGSWAKFLVEMAQREATSRQSPDTILFLGAWGSHEWDKVPKDMIRRMEISNARIFYFEYFPYVGGAPDGVERFTRDLHGAVFTIRSPESLAQAIKKTMTLTAAAPSY